MGDSLTLTLASEDGKVVYTGTVLPRDMQLSYGEDGKPDDVVLVIRTATPELELDGIERIWMDDSGQTIYAVHAPADCVGRPCCIHAPSDHHMRDFPRHWRFDRRIMERICPHGVGHPDPDDAAYQLSAGIPYDGTHGCDGCCVPPGEPSPFNGLKEAGS